MAEPSEDAAALRAALDAVERLIDAATAVDRAASAVRYALADRLWKLEHPNEEPDADQDCTNRTYCPF